MKENLLQIQELLRSFNDWDAAIEHCQSEPLNMAVNRFDNLVTFNYCQLNTPGDMESECRGLILEYGSWDVVGFSFRRFFNYGESRAAEINWNTAKVLEKIDGTLITFFKYDGKWNFSTRKMIGGYGTLPAGRFTWRERIDRLFAQKGHTMDSAFVDIDDKYCIIAEYAGPYNRIVTPYDKESLTLLTVTDKTLCQDVDIDTSWWIFNDLKRYNTIGSLDQLIALTNTLPALDEGYVVVDDQYNRIKVKNPAYFAISKTINAGAKCTDKHFALLAINGHSEEYCAYFPELAKEIHRMFFVLEKLTKEANELWERYKHYERKEFAMQVKDHMLSPWLFQCHSGRMYSLEDWVKDHLRPERLALYVEREIKNDNKNDK